MTDTHVEVEIINIAASFYMASATRQFQDSELDMATHMPKEPPAGPAAIFHRASVMDDGERDTYLIDNMGHRSVFDYELNHPRYSETPDVLATLFNATTSEALAENREKPERTLPQNLQISAEIAARYQSLKEDAKHQSLRQLAVMRRAVLALDKKLEFGGLIFFLTFAEIVTLTPGNLDKLKTLAEERRRHYRAHMKLKPMATSLTLAGLEKATDENAADVNPQDGEIKGKRISGGGKISGRAYVASPEAAETGAELTGFSRGDILVCPLVHPTWLPQVLRAGGVISKVGGWLSHIAIVARDNNIPMIVGTRGQGQIGNGDMITLNVDGSVVIEEATDKERAVQAAE